MCATLLLSSNIFIVLGLPCLLLHKNEQGGQRFHFLGGHLVSLSDDPPPAQPSPPLPSYNNHPGSPNAFGGGYLQGSPNIGYGRPPPSPYGAPLGPYGSNPSTPGSPLPPYGGSPASPGFAAAKREKPLALIEPFYVLNPINTVWEQAGAHNSKYGRPLCDEQDLPDGGRCSIFEGGHIHAYNGEAQE